MTRGMGGEQESGQLSHVPEKRLLAGSAGFSGTTCDAVMHYNAGMNDAAVNQQASARGLDAIDAEVLETILDKSHDHILVTDGTGNVVRASASTCAIYGFDIDRIIGQNVHELERSGKLSPSVTVMVLTSGEPAQVMQTTESGRRVLAEAFPVRQDGRIVRVISFSRDLTDLQLLQQEYELLQQRFTEQLRLAHDPHLEDVVAVEALQVRSPVMRDLAGLLRRIAPTEATVLMLGESGVGKTAFARQLHAWSWRAQGPFVDVNCGAIPETLFEAEMFGYAPGAFTGARRQGKAGLLEQADGGTLLLDEIGELPAAVQAKLLNVLQDGRVQRLGDDRHRQIDFRLVAATNQNLEEKVEQGRFRLDLYYRLNVVPVTIPPLRERREDIPPLVELQLERLNHRYAAAKVLDTRAWSRLLQEEWPGNVRELENVLERWFVASEGDVIQPFDAAGERAGVPRDDAGALVTAEAGSLADVLERTERAMLIAARADCSSTYAMAERLGISQATVVRKLRRHGLASPGRVQAEDLE